MNIQALPASEIYFVEKNVILKAIIAVCLVYS